MMAINERIDSVENIIQGLGSVVYFLFLMFGICQPLYKYLSSWVSRGHRG